MSAPLLALALFALSPQSHAASGHLECKVQHEDKPPTTRKVGPEVDGDIVPVATFHLEVSDRIKRKVELKYEDDAKVEVRVRNSQHFTNKDHAYVNFTKHVQIYPDLENADKAQKDEAREAAKAGIQEVKIDCKLVSGSSTSTADKAAVRTQRKSVDKSDPAATGQTQGSATSPAH